MWDKDIRAHTVKERKKTVWTREEKEMLLECQSEKSFKIFNIVIATDVSKLVQR
jgi:hypothetical protein